MKRLCVLLLIFTSTLMLAGCQTNEEDIDLTTLPYYSYLSEDNPVVTIKIKSYGEIKLQLFPDVAENTVNNFISYIEEGSYSRSTFHRIIEDFMIQGGIVSDTGCTIKGEFTANGERNSLSHDRGVISMARTYVNNSATSQFFIVHKDSDFLDGSYAAFGGMISGFNILDELAQVSTDGSDVPNINIVIRKISVDLNGYSTGDVICAD